MQNAFISFSLDFAAITKIIEEKKQTEIGPRSSSKKTQK